MIRIPQPDYLLRLCRSLRPVPSAALRHSEEVLAFYDLGRWQLVGPLLGGRSSHNLLLQTDRGEKVLKKYRWSLRSTLQEHSILRHLDDTDFPCPRVMLNRDGGTFTELHGEHYAVYDFIRGFHCDDYYMPARLRRRFAVQAGETLARFHRLMDGFVPEGRKIDGFMPGGEQLWRDTTWHLDVIEQYVGGIGRNSPHALDSLVLRNVDKLKRDMVELGGWHERVHPQLPKQVIHGDYVAKNVVFDSQGLVGVLDLGSARLDLRILDIARALQSFAHRRRYGLDASLARIFLEAYRTQVPLSDDEVVLIPELLRWLLLRLIIWLLEEGDLALSRRLASFRDRWTQARWLQANGAKFLDDLLPLTTHHT